MNGKQSVSDLDTTTGSHESETAIKPMLAPCSRIDTMAPLAWLKAGWHDVKSAPRISFLYGSVVVLVSWAVSALAWYLGSYVLLLSALSGFIFIAPLLALGLYSVSRHLAKDRRPLLRRTWREMKRGLGQSMVYALVLLIIFLVWARAGSMVHIFMPTEEGSGWEALLLFLGVGSAVGSIFALVSFAASAFSLPMIADRDCDMITAVITSVNAVLNNKTAMLVWIVCIVSLMLGGMLLAGIGLMIVVPWLAYATWHGYRSCIEAKDWNELPLMARPKALRSTEKVNHSA
jgi:uncharacterized membrane protein